MVDVAEDLVALADLRGLAGDGDQLRCPVCRKLVDELVLPVQLTEPMCARCFKSRRRASLPVQGKLLL